MSTRLRAAGLCAAFLACAVAPAKPPDLPLEERDQCREHRPGALASEPAEEASAEEAGPAVVIDALSPVGGLLLVRRFAAAVSETLRYWYAGVAERFGAGGGDRMAGGGAAPTCPYLRQKALEAAAATDDEPDLVSEDIITNLDRLERARAAYLRAERYRKAGMSDVASLYYERARFLCPGSRFDSLATARLRAVYGCPAPGGAEAAEEIPPP